MYESPITRRNWLRSGMAASGGALAALSALPHGVQAAPEPEARPSGLKITKVETFSLEHKLPKAVGVSILALSAVRDTLLVKIGTDSGLAGWGETDDVGGTRGVIEEHLKGKLLGANPLEHRRLWRSLWGHAFGDGRAVGAVDVALHDLRGKALRQSVAELYGGRARDKVLAYAAAMNYTEGVRPEDQYPAEAAALVQRGFKAMKMRTGRLEPRRDLAVLAKVRETVGRDIRLLTDGNGAFTLPQAVKFGKALEQLDFYCFEEPLPQGQNYAGYDVLTQSLDIAISGGESLDSRSAARDHIVKRSFDIIQPDVMLCGGVAEALFIAEMARLWSVQCIPHCWSSAVATAATLQVLSLLPPDTFGASSDEAMLEFDVHNPFRDEIVTRPFEVKDGYVAVPTGPGLGIEIDEQAVRKFAAKK